jgi:hypothetical protein
MEFLSHILTFLYNGVYNREVVAARNSVIWGKIIQRIAFMRN